MDLFCCCRNSCCTNKFIAGIPEGLFRAIGHSAKVNLNLSWFGQSLVQDFTIQDIKHHKVGFQLKYFQFRDQVNKSVKNMLCLKYKIAYVSRAKKHINPFVPNAPFLYPLKNIMFSGGRERVHWERMGWLKSCRHKSFFIIPENIRKPEIR